MSVFIYTEDERPLVDGPFPSIEDAALSRLWEYERACVWIEEHTAQGWRYENVQWTGYCWVITSKGVRPLELIRPSFLEEARAVA